MSFNPALIKALTFDVFGTVVDWRTSIIEAGQALGKSKGINIDWGAFANAWRQGYRPAMDRVRSGELPWTKFDDLHRMRLDELLTSFGICGLSEPEKQEFNRAWRRLTPWPDSIKGLRRLRDRFVIATLSNGNMAQLTNLSKHAGLPWDCILAADLVRHYKPDPEVYEMAAELLDLQPQQIMMVAAHQYDLHAAASVGLHTAFVKRPLEFGPADPRDLTPDAAFNVVAEDLADLAVQLGV